MERERYLNIANSTSLVFIDFFVVYFLQKNSNRHVYRLVKPICAIFMWNNLVRCSRLTKLLLLIPVQ